MSEVVETRGEGDEKYERGYGRDDEGVDEYERRDEERDDKDDRREGRNDGRVAERVDFREGNEGNMGEMITGEMMDKMGIEWRMENAAGLTTFRGGGMAAAMYPRCEEELAAAMENLREMGVEPYILGGGSNAVIADGTLSRPIICTKRMRKLRFDGDIAIFEAGVTVAQLMREARKRGLGGLEFLEGVPATLGGALRMNAGAFGKDMSDMILYARVMKGAGVAGADEGTLGQKRGLRGGGAQDGGVAAGARDERGAMGETICEGELRNIGEMRIVEEAPKFAYRRGCDGLAIGGAIRMTQMSEEESVALRNKYLERRRAKQPMAPSCGSVFKNVTASAEQAEALGIATRELRRTREGFALPAGRLIDMCGLKGRTVGRAQISPVHANFIVNLGGATAEDLLRAADIAENCVYERFGIELEREFRLLT